MGGKTNPRTCLIIAVLLVGMGLVANTNVCKSNDVYIVVDDMEDYNDRNDIREVWRDGYADVVWGGFYPFLYRIQGGSSGSNLNVSTAVGSPYQDSNAPIISGGQAMVLRYDNDGWTYTGLVGDEKLVYDAPYYSEIEANTVGPNSLDVGQNWAGEGVQSLLLSFQGHPVSDGDFDATAWPCYTLYGRGRDIGGRHDEFYFLSQYPFTGAGSVQVQVLSVDNTDPWAKAGVMIREKWTPYSKFAAVFITPNNGVVFQYRDVEDGPTTSITKPGVTAPQYVKLERTISGAFEAKHSANGFVWQDVNAPNTKPVLPQIDMGTIDDPNIYVGTAVTSHNANQICAADFNNMMVSPFPMNWVFGNIGTNEAEQLYIALSDGLNTAVVKHNDTFAATLTEWQEWNIPLTAFTGVDFNSIKKVYIGLGDRDTYPDVGGSGTVYIDDIRLYKRIPLFVDSGAPAGGDGSSWANAYRYLQDALAAASHYNEIRVAEGTYKPDRGAGVTLGDRTATFQLINHVPIYGGYAGFGEPDPNARDIDAYPTILSGDIGTAGVNADNGYHVVTGSATESSAILDGFTITGGNANGTFPHDSGAGMLNSGSSPTVTNCTFSDNTALVRGGGMFNQENSNPTVTNCRFSSNSAGYGAGMRNNGSSPTVTNCTFSENSARGEGGGMDNRYDSYPAVTNCTFSGNTANTDGGGMYNRLGSTPTVSNCTFRDNSAINGTGGGMFNFGNSNPVVSECIFSGNEAGSYGGGIYNTGSSPTVTNCIFNYNVAQSSSGGGIANYSSSNSEITNCKFTGNSAGGDGGGMRNWTSNPTVTNCTFSSNTATGYGGGMSNLDNSSSTVTNCIFNQNIAYASGGGIANYSSSNSEITNCTFSGNHAATYGSGIRNWDSSPTVTNCILWDNEPNEISSAGTSIPVVNYSDIQNGHNGTGNINVDPDFVDADNPDPNLVNLRLKPDSPCIDAGDTTSVPSDIFEDVDGNPRGLDEPASPDTGISIFGVTVDMGAYEFQLCRTPGDINCDGVVDFRDVAIICENWLAGIEPEL